MFGKVDWLAHNLPVEGERAEPPTAGRVMRDDMARAGVDDTVEDVVAAIERSPYPFALITAEDGTLLGRVRASRCDGHSGRTAGEIMELAPSTVRPHRSAGDLAKRLADRDLRWAIVTTPEGRLLGVASRADLERAAQQSE